MKILKPSNGAQALVLAVEPGGAEVTFAIIVDKDRVEQFSVDIDLLRQSLDDEVLDDPGGRVVWRVFPNAAHIYTEQGTLAIVNADELVQKLRVELSL